MLSPAVHEAYRRDGFVVLPDIFTPDEVDALRRVTDAFVEKARQVAANDDIYDLEDSHTLAAPRVRQIRNRHRSYCGNNSTGFIAAPETASAAAQLMSVKS